MNQILSRLSVITMSSTKGMNTAFYFPSNLHLYFFLKFRGAMIRSDASKTGLVGADSIPIPNIRISIRFTTKVNTEENPSFSPSLTSIPLYNVKYDWLI
jgi:hypothetical protein